MILRKAFLILPLLLIALYLCPPVQSKAGKLPKEGKNTKISRQTDAIPAQVAYTTDHKFMIKLLSVPRSIPYERYFNLRLAVYDGNNPKQLVTNAQVKIFAGMRLGLKHGFANGMQSSPRILENKGVFNVSGMYFHMSGPWTLEITVIDGNRKGRASFQLTCCSY